jgi:hypothetical protein
MIHLDPMLTCPKWINVGHLLSFYSFNVAGVAHAIGSRAAHVQLVLYLVYTLAFSHT